MERLKDKVALITGAGTGSGQAMAAGFAKEGADIAVVYTSSRKGAEETAKMVEEAGRRALILQADCSKETDIVKAVEDTYKEFGRFDILVNNGAARDPALIEDYTEELWRHCIDTNIRGTFLGIQAAARIMKEHGGGVILSMTSVLGERPGLKERAGYAASKAGIYALTQAAAMELGRYNIRVNVIRMGAFNTNIGGYSNLEPPETTEKKRNSIPLKRIAEPGDEIVKPAVFMCSDDSAYITGSALVVDGGWDVVFY